MDKREWLLKVFSGEDTGRVPVGFWFHFLKGSEMSGALQDPSLIEKNLDGHRRYNEAFHPDFVKAMSDGLFYRPLETFPDMHCAHDLASVRPLKRDHPYFNACVDLAQQIRRIFGDDILIYYNVPAPFHHVIKKYNGTTVMHTLPSCITEDPEAFRIANDALVTDMITLSKRVMTEGTMDGIYLSLHNDNVFSTELYEEFIKDGELALLQAANAIHSYNIAHICGFAGRVNNFDVYKDYPAAVFNWSLHTTHLSIQEGKQFFDSCTCVIGGFDQIPGSLIHKGSREEIRRFVFDLLNVNGSAGFILGADCTIPSDTPAEHLIWAREACREWEERRPRTAFQFK